MKITIGSFPPAGEYLVIVNGCGWVHTKSLAVARRVARAIYRHEGADELDTDPVHVDEAVHYEEDSIPQWPRYTEANIIGGMMSLRVRVGDEVVEQRYCVPPGDSPWTERETEMARSAALLALDKHARALWDARQKAREGR